MIRPLTLLTLLAAGGAGLHLYQVKHQVSLLDKELREIRAHTEAARARTGVLRAEWQLLNDPERLRRNAVQFLQLETMQPAQFIRAADLDKRLPQAVAFAGARSLFAAPVDVAEAEEAPGTASQRVADAVPPRPDGAAAPQGAAGTLAAPAHRSVARAAEPAVRVEPVRLAEPAAPRPAPRPAFVAPRPAAPAPAPSPYRPVPSFLASANAAPVSAPPAVTSSALGGGGRPALAPPVPIASALPQSYGAR